MSLKKCSKCQNDFECCNEQRGCWCENLYISPERLSELRSNFDNCLCPVCLQEYADKKQ